MSTFPSTFKVSNIDFGNGVRNYASDSKSLKRNTRKKNAQRWEFSLDLFMKPEDAMANWAFLNSLDVNVTPVEINLSEITTTGAAIGQIAVLAPASIGSNLVSLVSNTNVPIGQMFKFSNHSKLYQVIGKTGSSQVTVYPALRAAVGAAHVADFANCPFTAYITTEIPKLNKTFRNSNTVITLEFVELA